MPYSKEFCESCQRVVNMLTRTDGSKECQAERLRNYHQAHRSERMEKKKERRKDKNSAEVRADRRHGRRYRKQNKLKTKARSLAVEAIRSGKLKRPRCCPKCGVFPKPFPTGKSGIDFHHTAGYDRENALIGEFICDLCHREEHGSTRPTPRSNWEPTEDEKQYWIKKHAYFEWNGLLYYRDNITWVHPKGISVYAFLTRLKAGESIEDIMTKEPTWWQTHRLTSEQLESAKSLHRDHELSWKDIAKIFTVSVATLYGQRYGVIEAQETPSPDTLDWNERLLMLIEDREAKRRQRDVHIRERRKLKRKARNRRLLTLPRDHDGCVIVQCQLCRHNAPHRIVGEIVTPFCTICFRVRNAFWYLRKQKDPILLQRGWSNLRKFFEEVGQPPTTDSVFSDGRWTSEVLTERTRHVTHDGETLTVRQWSAKTGLSERIIYDRVFKKDWTAERALTTPNDGRGRRGEKFECRGQSKTLRQWSEEVGVQQYVIRSRLTDGWKLEDAIFQPVQAPHGPRKRKPYKVTEEKIEKMVALKSKGWSNKKIGDELGLHALTVRKALLRAQE